MTMLDRVIVRVRRPNGSIRNNPSESLSQAMVSLADSDEMQPLLWEAKEEGKALAIDVYQNHEGRPILVSFAKAGL